MKILYEFCNLRQGVSTPEIDVKRVLDKFQYEGWEENTVERHYIQPLFEVFDRMNTNMKDLALKGMSESNIIGLIGSYSLLRSLDPAN